MRYDKVVSIVKLLFVFFKRSVLNFGIMKSKLFRYILVTAIAALTVIMSMLMYHMYSITSMSNELTDAIMDVYSLTTIMWTFVVFIFMKILFMKKDSFMQFTSQMPVTKVEKSVAIVIFEIFISLVMVNIIALSAVIAFIAYGGPKVILRILCNVFFTCSNVYLILELINRLTSYLVDLFELKKMKDTILICLFMGVFFLMYVKGIPLLTDEILFAYMDKKGTNVIAIFAYIMEHTHFIVSAYLFLALFLALLAVICLIPEEVSYRTKQFIILHYNIENFSYIRKKLEKNSLFASYFVNVSRRVDTLNLGILIVFSYLFAIILKIDKPEYAVMLYAVNGLYMCIQTDGIRNILYQKDYDLVKDYIYMIMSQMLYMSIVSVPYVVISLVVGNSIKSIGFMYIMMFIVTIFSTFIGIVFVPKRENPMSIMVGITTVCVVALILVVGITVLQVNKIVQIIMLAIITCVIIYYSLLGLVSLKKESYYEY